MEETSQTDHTKSAKTTGCLLPGLLFATLLAPLSTACASGVAVGVSPPAPRAAAVVKVESPPTARVVLVRKPPPKLKREVRPRKPAGHYVWVSGHWHWHAGRGYVWKAGQWHKPPHRTAVWIKPRYEKRPAGWVYIAGHWR